MTDTEKDAAICPFCGEAYVVEKAIRHLQAPKDIQTNKVPSASRVNPPKREGAKKLEFDERLGEWMEIPVEDKAADQEAEALAVRIFQAIKNHQDKTIQGYYKCLDAANGTIEAESVLQDKLKDMLEQSLMQPSVSGSGMAELLAEYQENYAFYDVQKTELDEERVIGKLRQMLQNDKVLVHDMSIRSLTLNRSEWYEVKGFWGITKRQEKKLITKELKAVYVFCERTE